MKLKRAPASASVGPIRSSRSATTQIRIQEAASDLFQRRGYNATSVDDIAEAARVVKATFYYHFSGKEAIYTILCLKYGRDYRSIRSSYGPVKRLKESLRDALNPILSA